MDVAKGAASAAACCSAPAANACRADLKRASCSAHLGLYSVGKMAINKKSDATQAGWESMWFCLHTVRNDHNNNNTGSACLQDAGPHLEVLAIEPQRMLHRIMLPKVRRHIR